MEYIIFGLAVAILVILINFKSDLTDRLYHLELKIQQLKKQLENVAQATQTPPPPPPPVSTVPKPTKAESVKKSENEYGESGFKVVEVPEIANVLKEEAFIQPTVEKPSIITPPTLQTSQSNMYTHIEEKPSFFERNPDLEKFIGENLISKIGIAILVLAIGYFVKFAIDNNWIGAVGRVGVGLLCGAILTGAAHKLQNSYKAFSSVLIGGGLAVFYFTITLAYQQFHLFNQTTAFIIMVVITAFAVSLSLLYNRQEVAIIALVGGFASPFMASNGSGDYKTLFIYLIILNSALLAIAFKKGWRILNLLAFAFTIILYASWLFYSLEYNTPTATYKGGLVFASVFYLLFFAINLLHNIKENKKFIASDFGILLVNTVLYFGIGLYLLAKMDAEVYKGVFCICLAIFHLIVTYLLFKSKKVDINILYLLIGITLTFISLTAPIQLHGHYITLFWASETVLLYWLYIKSRIPIIQWTSIIIWGAMFISLLMDWSGAYANTLAGVQILFNKGFVSGIYCSGATLFLYILTKKVVGIAGSEIGYKDFKNILVAIGTILLFITGLLEISYQFEHYFPNQGISLLYTLTYVNVFVLLLTHTKNITREIERYELINLNLIIASVVFYLICLSRVYSIQSGLLQQGSSQHFLIHWVGTAITGFFLFKLISQLRSENEISEGNMNIYVWVSCAVIVIYLSVEINFLVNTLFYSKNHSLVEISSVYIKAVLPILWGLCSFVFMWFGMKFKYKKLRIISLSLFLITLLKLFIFDLSNIPIAGKIAAFFCLGVLLLVVSFMYQRLKKIIIEDEHKTPE